MTDGSSRGEGLLASLRGLVRTLIAIVQTRLAILAGDLEEQGACFAQIAIYAVISAISLVCAIVLAVVFVIVASGENRLIAIGILFALFFALALWSLVTLRKRLADRPKLLSATLAEFDKDKSALSGIHEVDR